MPKAKSKGVGKRRTGGGRTKGKANKQAARTGFETRHIDQVKKARKISEAPHELTGSSFVEIMFPTLFSISNETAMLHKF